MLNVKKSAIIFDMDGVIIDSEKLHYEAEMNTCRYYSLDAPSHEWDKFRGATGAVFFTHLIKNYAKDDIDLDKMLAHCFQVYQEIAKESLKMISGAKDFLKNARINYKKLGLATSSRAVSQEMVFNKFDLHSFFDAIVTAEDVLNSKPHPEPYLKAVKKLDLEPEDCFVIEDSDNGIRSARAAGCLPIGITTSFKAEKLWDAGAEHVFNNYEEISIFLLTGK
jgi:beta-phosphoglucomutase